MEKYQIKSTDEVSFTEWNNKQYLCINPVDLSGPTEFELPTMTTEILPVTVGTLGDCEITLNEEEDNITLRQPDGSSQTFFQLLNVTYPKLLPQHLSGTPRG